ncbi:MAG: hypothetical protein A2Z34_07715 [Planctomycetes bacterium RBG_16_59_8]|nr:MAG: hypothetical protein A2Z34_07715 [Planctomycetes bacterium RBG_16_59_8]
MKTTPNAGTIVLDGLLEGPVPAGSDIPRKLEEWISFAKQNALAFSIEIEANRFSILPHTDPILTGKIVGDPQIHVKKLLQELLTVFPSDSRAKLFSTIRSVEYRSATKIETIYRVAPDGTIVPHEREVEWTPAPPLPPRSPVERFRLYIPVLLIFLLLAILSTFFVDYRSLWSDLAAIVDPVKVDEIAVDSREIEIYILVRKKEMESGGSLLAIELQRTAQYPSTFDNYLAERERLTREKKLSQALILETILRGTITLEYYDSNGKLLSVLPLRIKELASRETFRCTIPINHRHRPLKVKMTY